MLKFLACRTDRCPMAQFPDDAASRRPAGGFPGGRVRLPRRDGDRSSGPQIDMVDTAFIGGRAATVTDDAPTGFTGYFTYESLFEDPTEHEDGGSAEDPYKVLGVERTQEWSAIVAAHRALVKEFHPDRFVDHPAEVVAQAEVEIKRINRAYDQLRKDRAAAGGSERRSGGDRRRSAR